MKSPIERNAEKELKRIDASPPKISRERAFGVAQDVVNNRQSITIEEIGRNPRTVTLISGVEWQSLENELKLVENNLEKMEYVRMHGGLTEGNQTHYDTLYFRRAELHAELGKGRP